MAVQLITKSAYARHRGCDEKAVRKAVNEGRISAIDGKIDPAVADIQWAQNTRARIPQNAAPGAPAGQLTINVSGEGAAMPDAANDKPAADPSYMKLRIRREQAEAEEAEMRTAKIRGTMVLREDVDRAMFEILRETRDLLTSCARRIASEVASSAVAETCESIIDREHRIVLDLMSTSFREKVGAPPKVTA